MFFTYRQNNTGGIFHVNDNIAHFVIIEAESEEASDIKAKNIGLYFDGFNDCECCGARWVSMRYCGESGTTKPSAYGKSIKDFLLEKNSSVYEARIHYKNGKVEKLPDNANKLLARE